MMNANDNAKMQDLESILQPGVTANDAFNALVVYRVESYLRDLEGVRGLPLYEMITQAAERPLLDWAMKQTNGNQRAAATLLGINRNTLRKKLVMHGFSGLRTLKLKEKLCANKH